MSGIECTGHRGDFRLDGRVDARSLDGACAARLRRFALNVLRANPDQGSTRGKIKRAAWDDAFLLNLLATP